jgi:hypothetical protein
VFVLCFHLSCFASLFLAVGNQICISFAETLLYTMVSDMRDASVVLQDNQGNLTASYVPRALFVCWFIFVFCSQIDVKSVPRFQFTAEHAQVRLAFQASLLSGPPRHLRPRAEVGTGSFGFSGSGTSTGTGGGTGSFSFAGSGTDVSAQQFCLQFDRVVPEYKIKPDPSAPPMTLTAKDAPYTVAPLLDDTKRSKNRFYLAPGFLRVLPGSVAT